ncbi:hypothetical protein [Corynebacterium cystitidis]|uniref:Predicted Permease Membrane Region n=1 Tax=Corynebacterium cystitidis DSM 20524 TaxID=1121357 RepID=A0A1H9QK71_9CORY|nr:hypothetical protein [Corynebacterium cystitidis]WJY81743.1 putative transporter [Corynebacterium cystitidis DSM 20524]SER60862.1 Predicted Permease Membrane Region [Corynebacterium cystitidis DSM 20524]SNV84127.1 transporter protein [Corynebacterium cystitidis]
MGAAVVSVIIGRVTALACGGLIGMSREVTVGVFSGATTSTPSLAVATQQTGSELPAVGYSLAYPMGDIVAILLLTYAFRQKWSAKHEDFAARVGEVLPA